MENKKGLAAKFFGKLKMSEEEKNKWQEEIKKRRKEIQAEFENRRLIKSSF